MTKKQLQFLAEKLDLYPKDLKRIYNQRRTRKMKIDRETAQKWLDRCFKGQRTVRRSHVKNLSARMKARCWIDNGEPIVFDYYGRLINGQHRLLAIVDSDVTIEATVIWGMDPIAYLHMDEATAARRSEDYLKFSRGNKAVTAYRWMLALQESDERAEKEGNKYRGFVGIGRKPIPGWDAHRENLLFWCYEHQDVLERVTSLVARKEGRPVMPPAGLAAGFYLWIRLDHPNLADEFFERLVDGLDLGREDPIYVLRTKLLEIKAKAIRQMGTSTPYYEYCALLIRAWNAFVTGKKIKALRFSGNRDTWPVRVRRPRRKAT